MDDHSLSLGLEGGGWQVQAIGQVWVFLPFSMKLKSEYCAWVKRHIIQTAIDQKQALADQPNAYRELLAAANADIAAGNYNWGQAGCANYMQSADGSMELIRLTLAQRHPDVTVEQVEAILTENPDGAKWAMSEVVRDPNSLTPPLPEGRMGRVVRA